MFNPGLCMTLVKQRGHMAPFLHGGDLCAGIATARAFGYDCVEIHVRAPEELDLPALKEALLREDMLVSALGTGRAYVDDKLSLIDPDEQARRKALTRLHGFIDAAAELHAMVIIGCLRGNVPSPGREQESLHLLGEAMQKADAYASARSVSLVLEAINRYENNYLCSIYEVAAFIEKNKLRNTGILADTFHMNIEERDIVPAFSDNMRYIRYVHAADSNRRYPGGGHTDFPAILKALKDGGYQGNISAEILPLPDDDAAAKLWLAHMKGYLLNV